MTHTEDICICAHRPRKQGFRQKTSYPIPTTTGLFTGGKMSLNFPHLYAFFELFSKKNYPKMHNFANLPHFCTLFDFISAHFFGAFFPRFTQFFAFLAILFFFGNIGVF